jgi:hypothetical protein
MLKIASFSLFLDSKQYYIGKIQYHCFHRTGQSKITNWQSRESGNIAIGYTRRRQTKQKHNTICVDCHYTSASTTNANKTRVSYKRTEHCFYAGIITNTTTRTHNEIKTYNRTKKLQRRATRVQQKAGGVHRCSRRMTCIFRETHDLLTGDWCRQWHPEVIGTWRPT